MPITSVTLDLDGTLLDTVPDLAGAANAMLLELGLPPRSEEEVRRFVGRGIGKLVERCIGDAAVDHAQALAVFRRHYARCNGHGAQPYPGVREGLECFRARGLPMGVITNKSAEFTGPLLAATGLAPYFRFALSGDSLPEKKPHPRPLLEACARLNSTPPGNLHIGDSRHDAAAARAAGCPVFLVPYGYNEGQDVRGLDCDAIVATLMDAAARIESL
ncbi:MAG: phosphoglycolate phosphatase [Proteobacteria bacterium]|nr:phosphoglycolate phosphatase [Pseudomonadota bacterium]HQR04898.1 phosphoglycolate phosphatase [Rhodocyclaceae bacterium]